MCFWREREKEKEKKEEKERLYVKLTTRVHGELE